MKQTKNDSTKVRSSFSGGLLGLFVINFVTSFLSTLTLGIAYPWLYVWQSNWFAKHTTYNGRKLLFVGKGGQLFGLILKWFLLTIITLGIYGLFIPVKLLKWKTENTHFADGQRVGQSKFLGNTWGLIGNSIICALLFIITLGIAFPSVIAIMTNWERKHTVIDGYKLSFNGRGISLIGHYLLWILLTIITIGIYSLWIPLKFENWKVSYTDIIGHSPEVALIDVKPEPVIINKIEEKPKAEKVKTEKVIANKVSEPIAEDEPTKRRKKEFRITNNHTSVLALICYVLWLVNMVATFILMSQKTEVVSINMLVLSIVYTVILVLAIIVEIVLLSTKGEKRFKRVQSIVVFSTLYLIMLIAYGVVEFLTPILLEDMWFMYVILGLFSITIFIILFNYFKLYKKVAIEKSNDEKSFIALRKYVNIFFVFGIILLLTLFPLTMYSFSFIHTLGHIYQLSVIFFEMSIIYLLSTLNIILFFNNVVKVDLYQRIDDTANVAELEKANHRRIDDLLLSATKKLYTKPLSEDLKTEAFNELEEAINLGSVVAYTIVGKYYEEHRIYRMAVKYYKKGADRNCPDSTLFLSNMYKYGAGIERNVRKSYELLEKSAELGNIKAMRTLYIMHIDRKRFKTALKYLLMAHEAGDFKSTLILAQSYAVGNLIVKGKANPFLAETYFLKANELASKKSEKSTSYNLVGQLYASHYPKNEDKDILKRSLYFLVNAERLDSEDAIRAIRRSEINELVSACLLEEINELDTPNRPILKTNWKKKVNA